MLTRPLLEPLRAFGRWLRSGRCMILDRDTNAYTPLIPTMGQLEIYAEMVRQAAEGLPIRVIVPKQRREGVSTLIQAAFVFLCDILPNQGASTLAHTKEDTAAIFRIARRIQTGDGNPADQATTHIHFPNESVYECRTAGSKSVHRGGGLTLMHVTELAFLQREQGLDAEAITSIVNALPDAPHTIGVIEGTGDGPTGEFYRRCMQAAEGKGAFRLVFLPWHRDKRNARPVADGFTPTDAELSLAKIHGLTNEQLQWRRMKRDDHSDDAAFVREYPSTLEDCFAVAKGRVYGMFERLKHVKKCPPETIKKWARYRAIDWGWTESQPLAVLWVAHDKKGPPCLSVDPSCVETIKEFGAYVRDDKTGDPMDEQNHFMDDFRYLCVTFNLHGSVHIYRELRASDGAMVGPSEIARRIHKLSGATVPAGKDIARSTGGEKYAGNVADRSQPGLIRQFIQWGITPLIGQRKPARVTGKGEIEDGIAHVSNLLMGDANFSRPQMTKVAKLKARVAEERSKNQERNRPIAVDLTPEEERVLAMDEAERMPNRERRESPMFDILGVN